MMGHDARARRAPCAAHLVCSTFGSPLTNVEARRLRPTVESNVAPSRCTGRRKRAGRLEAPGSISVCGGGRPRGEITLC